MSFQIELRGSKQLIRGWVRSHFSDQQLASVAAFNQDRKMSFRNPCSCLMGVTYSGNLHVSDECDGLHYWRARREDLTQTRRFAAWFPNSRVGKVEKAYIFLGFSDSFYSCFGDDSIRQRRFAAILRAEMRHRSRTSQSAASVPAAASTSKYLSTVR
jgi:hypothetical protein